METRTIAWALAATLAGAGWVWADCAQYISGGADSPSSGFLLGETLVTEETSFGADAGIYAERSVSQTWSVGHYRMTNGTTISVDCRTYTQI